jgi:hypothetical protein
MMHSRGARVRRGEPNVGAAPSSAALAAADMSEPFNSSAGLRVLRYEDAVHVCLDDPPGLRWAGLLAAASRTAGSLARLRAEARAYMAEYLPHNAVARWAIAKTAVAIIRFTTYAAEIIAIAAHAGMEEWEVAALNMVYDAQARCTAVLCHDEEGTAPLHVRTLDWPAGFLRKHTIRVALTRGGTVVAHAVTWPGFVGVLTGVAPGRFSISMNARQTTPSLLPLAVNVLAAATGRCWVAGALIRHVLETAATYDEAVALLSTEWLVGPLYFTVAGTRPNEGVLLTRSRMASLRPLRLADDTAPLLVQTNHDWWDTVTGVRDGGFLGSVERVHAATASIATAAGPPTARHSGTPSSKGAGSVALAPVQPVRRVQLSAVRLAQAMDVNPVRNWWTVYICVMQPSATGASSLHCAAVAIPRGRMFVSDLPEPACASALPH